MCCTRFRELLCLRLCPILALAFLPAVPVLAAQSHNSGLSNGQVISPLPIPEGTILPARLNQSISSKNAKPGQILTARIMQDVPLPNGRKIPAGSKIAGKIISVQPCAKGAQSKIELRFDALLIRHQSIPVVTSLRAIAGFMEVQAAQVPEYTPGFGTPYYWVPTRQIGGDEKYGVGDPVTNRNSERVGTGVFDGVLVHLRASPDSRCRGPFGEDDRLQALWVFSSDACGVYGMDDIRIAHAGRTAPQGSIVLSLNGRDLNLHSSDALLLRVR